MSIPAQPVNLDQPTAGPLLQIGYVSDLTRAGISVEQDGQTLRVVAPRIAWWEVALDWKFYALLVLGYWSVGALWEGRVTAFTCVATAAGICLLAYMAHTVWRRRVFEVTPDLLRMGYVRGQKPIWIGQWPRRSIGEVKRNRFNGKLLIRITGKDMKEYRLAGGREATEQIARVLSEAVLGRPAPLSDADHPPAAGAAAKDSSDVSAAVNEAARENWSALLSDVRHDSPSL